MVPGRNNTIKGIVSACSSDPVTHWGLVTHVCVIKLQQSEVIIDSSNGLTPVDACCQIITYTNVDFLGIRNKLQRNQNQITMIFFY